MALSKVIWSSPQINRTRTLRDAETSNIRSIKSLKFQIFLFLAILSEMCLNLMLRFFGGSDSSIYLYKLMCKTLLTINLIFIIGYIFQIIHSNFCIYVNTRENKSESIILSVVFDLVPQVRYYYQKIMNCKWVFQWLNKEALEKEMIKTKMDEERRRTLYKMYLPSSHTKYNNNGPVNGKMYSSQDMWSYGLYQHSSYQSMPNNNMNVTPNTNINNCIVPLGTSTPYSRRKVLSPFSCDVTSIYSPIAMAEERAPKYLHMQGETGSNSFDNLAMKYQPSTASPFMMNIKNSPISGNPTTHSLRGILDEVSPGDVWRTLGVDGRTLDRWTLNLRQWLHGTIIIRVVQEVDKVNQGLVDLGIHDIRLGGDSNIQSMRQLVTQYGNMFPSLSMLIDFLDCSKDLAYVVNRLKELSQGSSIGKFQWDSGSSGGRHPWRDHLPNDTMLILHLLSTYIDSRVQSTGHGLTSFSQQFIVDNVDNKDIKDLKEDMCALLQTSVQPPHFKVIINQTLLNVAPGRRNLFECLLVFFFKVYKNEGGLRWLNLGRSGLNLNWIFDEST